MEAFSDAVFAVIITLMALDIHAPAGAEWRDLRPLEAPFLIHILAFTFVGLYWNNHHHLLRTAQRITGSVMWANLHLMFWLSLVPVATSWVGEEHDHALPAATYGFIALASAVAYAVLVRALLRAAGPGSQLAAAIGSDFKGNISVVLYVLGIAGAWISPWVAYGLYVVVALIWFVPDRRFHRHAHG